MFKDIFFFELKYRFKRPSSYLYFVCIFLMVFMAVATDSIIIGEEAGNMLRNSPSFIFRLTAIISAFGMIVTSAMMSTPVFRDFEHETHHLLFSYPLKKSAYVAGRFFGSLLYFICISINTARHYFSLCNCTSVRLV